MRAFSRLQATIVPAYLHDVRAEAHPHALRNLLLSNAVDGEGALDLAALHATRQQVQQRRLARACIPHNQPHPPSVIQLISIIHHALVIVIVIIITIITVTVTIYHRHHHHHTPSHTTIPSHHHHTITITITTTITTITQGREEERRGEERDQRVP